MKSNINLRKSQFAILILQHQLNVPETIEAILVKEQVVKKDKAVNHK